MFWKMIVAVGTTALLAAVSAPASAEPIATSARHDSTSTLDVRVSGLPAGTRPHVVVTGPADFRRVIRAPGMLEGVRPGRYQLHADSVVIARAIRGVPAGSVALATPPSINVMVEPGRRRRVTVLYGTIRSGHTHALTTTPLHVTGSPSNPSAITLPGAGGLSVGSIVAAAPSATLPAGLFDRVTRLVRHGSQVVLSVVPASIAEAFPALNVDTSVSFTFGSPPAVAAHAHTALDLGQVDLSFSHDLIPGKLEGSCGAPPTGWSLSPYGRVRPTLHVQLHRAHLGLVYGELSLALSGGLGFDATLPSAAHCDLTIPGPSAETVVPIAGIPVPVEGSVGLGISLALEGSAHIHAEAQVTITGGANLHGLSATPILRVQPSATGSVQASGGRLSIGPEMQVGLGVNDVNGHVDDSLAVVAKGSNSSCEIDIGGTAGIGLDLWSLHAAFTPIAPEVPVYHCPTTIGGGRGGGEEHKGGTGGTGGGPEERPAPTPEPLPWSIPLSGLAEQLVAPTGRPEVQTLSHPAPQPQWQTQLFNEGGTVLSTVPAQSGSSAPPALAADGSGYAAVTDPSGEEQVERISASGQVEWTKTLGSAAAYTLVIGGDGNAYVDDGGSQVIGLDARTGSIRFTHNAISENDIVIGIAPEPSGVAVIEERVVLFLDPNGNLVSSIPLQDMPAGDYRIGTYGHVAVGAAGELFLTMLDGGGTDCEHRGPHPATAILKIAASGVQWRATLPHAPDPCYLMLAALPNGGVAYVNRIASEQAVAALTSDGQPAWTRPIPEETMSIGQAPMADSANHVDVLIASQFACADHAPGSYCDGQLFEELDGATGELIASHSLVEAGEDRSTIENCGEAGFAIGSARFYLLDGITRPGGEAGCQTNNARLESYLVPGGGAPYPAPMRERLP